MVKIIDLYENMIMTVDIPDGLNGNLLFSIRGLVQISEKSGTRYPWGSQSKDWPVPAFILTPVLAKLRSRGNLQIPRLKQI